MAGTYDSENQRAINRIMCIAFWQACDTGAAFIDRKWIAEKLSRSACWVLDNWNKTPEECFTEFGAGRPLQPEQRHHCQCQSQTMERPSESRPRNPSTLRKRGF